MNCLSCPPSRADSDVDARRYARQRSVAGIGEAGQRAIALALAQVDGEGLDAEVCALYLAGGGVGSLRVAPRIASLCRALNGRIEVVEVQGVEAQEEVRDRRGSLDEPAFRKFPQPSDVVVRAERAIEGFQVSLLSPRFARFVPTHSDALMRGSLAARWVFAGILREAGARDREVGV